MGCGCRGGRCCSVKMEGLGRVIEDARVGRSAYIC